MTETELEFSPQAAQNRKNKPRVALMGEFSAGKSTLMNLFLGCDPMPVRITATRVPPVWVTYGVDAATRICEDGTEQEILGGDLTVAPMEDTQLIQLSMDSDILHLCDLVDIPGISDPNMRHEDWLGLLDDVDCVIWCTHATQAWRQSEAALWEQISDTVTGPNFLVVTQFDKLRSERDRARVLARLDAETEGLFEAILPISTLDAINAGVDEEAWIASGGAALVERFVSALVNHPGASSGSSDEQDDVDWDSEVEEHDGSLALHVVDDDTQQNDDEEETGTSAPQDRVLPRRVRPITRNPDRPSATELARQAPEVALFEKGR